MSRRQMNVGIYLYDVASVFDVKGRFQLIIYESKFLGRHFTSRCLHHFRYVITTTVASKRLKTFIYIRPKVKQPSTFLHVLASGIEHALTSNSNKSISNPVLTLLSFIHYKSYITGSDRVLFERDYKGCRTAES